MAVLPVLVVHGGAGRYTNDRIDAAKAGCAAAVRVGLAVLARGDGALDASQAAVVALEDDPTFNAGVGSVLTREGRVEVDAAIMDGRTMAFGAVAAVPDLGRGIDLARVVMEDGEHVLLCADGAWEFAREHGFEPAAPGSLITELAQARLQRARERRAAHGVEQPDDPGTVGACAVDADGHVAAATSTGGTTFKRPGRIGDTPLCGCGTFADDASGAASATGVGEGIVRVTMSRACADYMRDRDAAAAAWAAVDDLVTRVDGEGGIICADRHGRVGAAHNSPRMAYGAGMITADGRQVVIAGVQLAAGEDIMAALNAAAQSTS